MRIAKNTYNRDLIEYAEKYQARHGDGAIDPMALARDARKHGFAARQVDPTRQLAREFAKALKHVTVKDRQGRPVREWHAVREKTEIDGVVVQHTLWNRKDLARPKFMRASLQQRREGILHDCLRLKADSDSYNDNNKFGAKLPEPEFNFEPDIEEHGESTEYPDAPPHDEEEDV